MFKIGYMKNGGVFVNHVNDKGSFIVFESNACDAEYDSFKEFVEDSNELSLVSKFKAMNSIRDIIGFPNNLSLTPEVSQDYLDAYTYLTQQADEMERKISKYNQYEEDWGHLQFKKEKSYILVEWTENDTCTGNTCDITSCKSYDVAMTLFKRRREELEDMSNFDIEFQLDDSITYTYDCNGGRATLHLGIEVKDIESC